jgi:hypothetical protein
MRSFTASARIAESTKWHADTVTGPRLSDNPATHAATSV